MRRPLLAIALLIIALLALCGFVLGVFTFLGQNNLAQQLSEIKTELGKGNPPPAPSANPGSTTSGSNPTTPPTTGGSCVGENGDINVNLPNSKCCNGLIEVGVNDPGELLRGITAKCIKLN